MKSKSDILKQLYLILIGLALILLVDSEKVNWIGWALIIEYMRKIVMFYYRKYSTVKK